MNELAGLLTICLNEQSSTSNISSQGFKAVCAIQCDENKKKI